MLEMDFIPEDELSLEVVLLKPGPAHFLVKGFKDHNEKGFDIVNKKGEKMVIINFAITDQEKTRGLVSDFISTSCQWKVKALADACGCPEIYAKNENGKLVFDPNKLIGMVGECTIRTYTDNGKERTTIDKYKRSLGVSTRKFMDDKDDDIPF